MGKINRKDLWSDRRWWTVGAFTILASVLLPAVVFVGRISLFHDGGFQIVADGLAVVVAGLFMFGPFVWLWGLAVGWFVWPALWNLPFVHPLGVAIAAAVSAFGVALLGGVVPFAFLGFPNWQEFSIFFFVPALVALLVGPVIAYLTYMPRHVS